MLIPLGIVAASGGGILPGDFELIETQVLTGTQSSVTFSGLSTYSSTYRHLHLRLMQRVNNAENGWQSVMYFNGDQNAGNYAMHRVFSNGGAIVTENVTSGGLGGIAATGRHPAGNAPAGVFGATTVDLLDAYNTSKNTTARILNGMTQNENYIGFGGGLYLQTAAISSVTIYPQGGGPSYVAGSRFSIYGVR